MSTILTVLKYDFRRFLRDWLMLAFSVFMLVIYVAVVLFVPTDITPTWDIAVTETGSEPVMEFINRHLDEGGQLKVVRYATEDEMKKAFEEGAEHFVGVALQSDAKAALARGDKPKARIYVDESSPPETQKTARAVGAMIASAAFFPDMAAPEEGGEKTLGPKIEQTTFKERTRALFAIMILIMEMLALGSLLSREISSGVVHAILTTTVSLPRYFASKMTFGVVLAFVQAGTVAALTGALSPNPVVITLLLFLGSIMFTAMGVVAGTRGRHLMEVMMWGMLFMLPCLVPAFTVMLPGSPPLFVQVIPTFPLIEGVLTAGHAEPLLNPWVYVGWTAGWTAALTAVAYAALRRRVK